jgi:hypothetical protein
MGDFHVLTKVFFLIRSVFDLPLVFKWAVFACCALSPVPVALAHRSDVVENAAGAGARFIDNEEVNWERVGLERHLRQPEDGIVVKGASLDGLLFVSREIGGRI